MAEKYIERGDFSLAIERLRRVVELDPENDAGMTDLSYYYLALSLASQGNEEKALLELDSLDSSFPQSDYIADSAFLRGQIYYHSGNQDQAHEVLAAYVQEHSGARPRVQGPRHSGGRPVGAHLVGALFLVGAPIRPHPTVRNKCRRDIRTGPTPADCYSRCPSFSFLVLRYSCETGEGATTSGTRSTTWSPSASRPRILSGLLDMRRIREIPNRRSTSAQKR